MAFAAKGQVTAAAKMFTKAMAQPDVKRAIATLEASGAQAFATVQASAKTKKVAASKKVTAGDDLDMGDEDDLEALVGADAMEMDDDMDDDMDDSVEETADADDMEEPDDFDGAEFAKVMASLQKPAKRK
jgi:hypothetical protein